MRPRHLLIAFALAAPLAACGSDPGPVVVTEPDDACPSDQVICFPVDTEIGRCMVFLHDTDVAAACRQ